MLHSLRDRAGRRAEAPGGGQASCVARASDDALNKPIASM
jgi:hypothetical protein